MTRLLKVARPPALVVALVVEPPVKAPGPLATLIVTVAPLSATALPNVSSTWTVGAGLIALPAVVVVGCWTKATLEAPAAWTLKVFEFGAFTLTVVSLAVRT